jgi:uncharacterized tellurite resistance protein B-like protein
MLTEGFDDPKVQTVVLAKLTLSTNRFWQMIGRGTRGVRAGGTLDCNVIDPIKLVRLYDYFGGYQPSVAGAGGVEDDPSGPDDLKPNVPVISCGPPPSRTPYAVSPELRRVHFAVARAIDAFLAGARLGEQEAVEIARTTELVTVDGGVVACPTVPGVQPEGTGIVLLRETILRMRERMRADLAWLDRQLPAETTDDVVRYWIRKLNAIEQLGLRSEDDYTRAEMSGRLSPLMATSVAPAPASSAIVAGGTSQTAPAAHPAENIAWLCSAVARADGVLVHAEIEVAVRVIGLLTGVDDGPALRAYLCAANPNAQECAVAVAALLPIVNGRKLLKGLIDVASADGVIHPHEVDVIVHIAAGLGMSREYVQGVLDFAS